MKLLLHENQLTERGTSVAMFDYAFYAREFLNIEPIIAYPRSSSSIVEVIERFTKEFEIFSYEHFNDVDEFISRRNIDCFYAIKYGYNDGILSKNARNLIHSVFSKDLESIHGDRYAVISEWQTLKSGIPYVPHMLKLDNTGETLRETMNIPNSDIVIGRYGGYDTFNIEFVHDSILKVLEIRSNLWFLFMNTEQKIKHPRCIYLEKTADLNLKTKFINSCDAMIHARDYGETFGLSVLEFAARNKAIISYDNEYMQTNHPLGGRNHFLFLKDQCYKYTCQSDLDYIFKYVDKKNPFDTSYLSDQFSPKTVMNIFEERFLL